MKKLLETLSDLGLSYDDDAQVIYGEYQGYPIYIWMQNIGRYNSNYIVSTSAVKDGQAADKTLLKEARSYGNKSISAATPKNFKIDAWVKSGMTKKKLFQNVRNALGDLTDFLKEKGFVPACEESGETQNLNIYQVSGATKILSMDSYAKYSAENDSLQQVHSQKSENYIVGTVGALLGSLLGVAFILLISQLGYVAAISGIVMGVCTVKGYELFAKKFSTVSAVICLLVVAGMTYFANELDWAIIVSRFYEVDIFTAFQALPELKSEEIIVMSDYWRELAMLIIFTLITAVVTIFSALKNSRQRYITRELSSDE